MDLVKCIFSNQRRMRRLNNNEHDNSSLHWNIRSILSPYYRWSNVKTYTFQDVKFSPTQAQNSRPKNINKNT